MSHLKAVEINLKAKAKTIDSQVVASNRALEISTGKVFSTAYYLAKQNRPFDDHPDLVELQNKNGANLGNSLHSRQSSTRIINFVSGIMSTKLCRQIRSVGGKISIQIDESTTVSTHSTLIIYMRCEIHKHKEPVTRFLDLVEIEGQDSNTIVTELLACLKKHGFTHEYLSDHLVAFASDGASAMIGGNSGVATQLKALYPRIVVWHCLNHRLELAVKDSLTELKSLFHFESFITKLYTIYSSSPKNVS